MATYEFRRIEKDWQAYWADNKSFSSDNLSSKPKYYVLDMFPYPSGAGLHVGHPLGYIASDIVARYKRHCGFNVLHPMGYDAFGLPAEQYAIQTGQHPAITTAENIIRYRQQLDRIGFSFDWDREVRTCDPAYYRWTQWVFMQLFNAWFNPVSGKAEPIESLVNQFEREGFHSDDFGFTAEDWLAFTEKERSDMLLKFRLAFLSEAMVNWCPALGTVLANDEVKDGVSERGGHPVERKLMTQWSLRISAYAERLLTGLEHIDWSDSLKEAQRNWIGKSVGCSLTFKTGIESLQLEVFTTRPDTIFGVTFLAVAPEYAELDKLCTGSDREHALAYAEKAKNRSERERQSEVKNISGAFTGTYALHPFTGDKIPVWVADYVLGGYGTGAVMAVPGHDSRDYAFAKHFTLPISEVVSGGDLTVESYDAKTGILVNSDFLNGLEVKEAIKKAIAEIEVRKLGKGKTNYRLRDAVFGRQRYWGEPIPVYYENGIPKLMDVEDLPLVLPDIDKYLPTETGEPPLARANNWTYRGHPLETTTMPGWAGSSWYFLRYMDPGNKTGFASKEALNYWKEIDLYMGGSEHATGHLLYFRFWTKVLFDLGHIPVDEPAKKLINQGMIQGVSAMGRTLIVQNISNVDSDFSFGNYTYCVSSDLADAIESDENSEAYINAKNFINDKLLKISSSLSPNVNLSMFSLGAVRNLPIQYTSIKTLDSKDLVVLDIEAIADDKTFKDYRFIFKDDFICSQQVEKMSKSKWNVINPDDVCEQYGADTLRLYEMFLGPLQDAKPWSTQGIEGVLRFLRKFWRLFHNNPEEQFLLSEAAPDKAELKVLHKTIKKATEDIEHFSFNTTVSALMVCVNELQDLKCNKRSILEPLVVVLAPYAPHIAEELWKLCGHREGVTYAAWPVFDPSLLVENEFNYPVSFNGKVRFTLNFALDMDNSTLEQEVLKNEQTIKYLEGKSPKKIIVVKGRIINIVV